MTGRALTECEKYGCNFEDCEDCIDDDCSFMVCPECGNEYED